MDTPETVTAAVQQLEELGFSADFSVSDVVLRCSTCGCNHEGGAIAVRHTYRFEGASDPADEAIVLGVECTSCGAKGIVVSAYGPDADPELLALIEQLAR